MSFLYATCRLVLFYFSTKYHQNILKGIRVTEQTRNLFQTKQREITPKVRKPELSFLYATRPFILFYISTKYHKNIPKGIRLTEQTQNQCIFTVNITKRDNAEKRKAELSFLYVTHPLILLYISTKYHQSNPKGIWVIERTRNLFQTKQREITPKVRKLELSFLYATLPLVLFYISTKYHQNFPKCIQVTEGTRSLCRHQRIRPKNNVPNPSVEGGDII